MSNERKQFKVGDRVEFAERYRDADNLRGYPRVMTVFKVDSERCLFWTIESLGKSWSQGLFELATEVQPYKKLGEEIGSLVEKKQAAYGDSFGKSGQVMAILYPGGIPPEKVDDALTIIRVLDKLFRVATDRDALGESPWRDIAGYALLAVKRQESRKAVGS